MVNSKPVVRIFGKDKKGKTVCVFYEDYLPYFYASDDVVKKEDEPGIQKMKKVKRKALPAEDKEMYKVTLLHPASTPKVREKFRSKGAEIYEADIPFKYRFMSDFGLRGMGWVEVENGNGVRTGSVRVDRKVKAEKLKPVNKEDDVDLKYLALDIECVSKENDVPQAENDPIILVSLVFSEPYKGKKSMVLSTKTGERMESFENEKEMLKGLIEIINEYDCDVITGFNIQNFDLPYILKRMEKNNIRPDFGRCTQKRVSTRKFGRRNSTYISGRVVVDSYEIVKKDFSLQRYGLDFVSQKLLNKEKEDVKYSEMEELWNGDREDLEKLARYCLKDSQLALDLVLKLNLIDKHKALSRVSGSLLQDTLDNGEASRIEKYLLREFNRRGYVFPSRGGKKSREGLIGGEVLEPKKGLQSSVAVLDFKSMYPSIIKSYNICPTTITEKEDGTLETPSGARFLKPEEREGIIPEVVSGLVERRGRVKEKLKKTRKKSRKKMLNAKQLALKILANSFYGYFGYARSKLFNLDIANAITSTGRDIIIKSKKSIEKEFGYDVVYGDTDSVFVKIPKERREDIAEEAQKIVDYTNEQLPGEIELEFEKIFKRFLPLTKKRYAAWSFLPAGDGWEDKIETKGIETVRRDWCGLVGKTVGRVLEIILKENDRKKAIKYFQGVTEKLLNNEIPVEDLVITKTMTKKPKNYEGVQPHIEVVKKMRDRNPADVPGVGDRIGFVIVKGTQMLSKRAEDPDYVREKGLQIDSNYYIETQLLSPLERVFGALDVSKSELLGNGKQIGIMEAMKNHQKDKGPEVMEEVSLAKANGFICRSCNQHYPHVPLTGLCKCGKELFFSSPDGPARRLVLD